MNQETNNEPNTSTRADRPERYNEQAKPESIDTNVGRQEFTNWGRSDGYHPGWRTEGQVSESVANPEGGMHQRGEHHFRDSEKPQYSSGEYGGLGPENFERSIQAMTEDIRTALHWNSEIDDSNIEIKVTGNGDVTLLGQVDDPHQKELAEGLAGAIQGVKDIQNQIYLRDDRNRRG